MSLLDNFELYNEVNEKPFITLRNLTITFSKQAIELLKYASFVHMYLNQEYAQVAFKPCEVDNSAIKFYEEPKAGKQKMVRLTGSSKSKMLMYLAGIKDCGKGIRFYGKYYAEEDLIIFDLRNKQNTDDESNM